MHWRALLFICSSLVLFCAPIFPQDSSSPPPARTAAEQHQLFEQVIANQKKNDEALYLYERIERVELRHATGEAAPVEVKTSRVVPAGTGIDHIPVGPDGQPVDAAAYRAELQKLERQLAWATESGRAQQDAYAKITKKIKERNDLIDATRGAFVFTYLAREQRGDRALLKFHMEPNPSYKPTSRFTAIYSKVRGSIWLDEASGQLARVQGVVTEDISVGLFLARVNKGSHFMQESYEMAPGLWLPSYSQYDFDGRKFFSSFSLHEKTFYSRYRRIGPPKEALQAIRSELNTSKTTAADP
jgi:hypothetical protein